MKEVFLTVGQRGAGKSHFVEAVAALDSQIVLISRDKILIRLCGRTDIDDYSGWFDVAYEEMNTQLRHTLRMNPDVRIILDTWNGTSKERKQYINFLKNELGADLVIAWYFITPLEAVDDWFWEKPGIEVMRKGADFSRKGIAYYPRESPKNAYEHFHRLAAGIDSDGFDEVVRINPLITDPRTIFQPTPI